MYDLESFRWYRDLVLNDETRDLVNVVTAQDSVWKKRVYARLTALEWRRQHPMISDSEH